MILNLRTHRAWLALGTWLLLTGAVGCASEADCPQGSVRVSGRCELAPASDVGLPEVSPSPVIPVGAFDAETGTDSFGTETMTADSLALDAGDAAPDGSADAAGQEDATGIDAPGDAGNGGADVHDAASDTGLDAMTDVGVPPDSTDTTDDAAADATATGGDAMGNDTIEPIDAIDDTVNDAGTVGRVDHPRTLPAGAVEPIARLDRRRCAIPYGPSLLQVEDRPGRDHGVATLGFGQGRPTHGYGSGNSPTADARLPLGGRATT